MESKYLMWSWMVIVFPFCEAMNENNNCLSCDEINRITTSGCVANYDQCGHCKPGFLPTENNSQNCSKFEILGVTEEMIETPTGSSVNMRCTFNTEVVCVWSFEKQTMAMESNPRFEFAENPDGIRVRRKDCSFRIERVTQSDSGSWECSNAVTSTNNYVLQKSIRLNALPHSESENLQRFSQLIYENSERFPLHVSVINSSVDTLVPYLVGVLSLLVVILLLLFVCVLFYALWKRFWKRRSKSQESLV